MRMAKHRKYATREEFLAARRARARARYAAMTPEEKKAHYKRRHAHFGIPKKPRKMRSKEVIAQRQKDMNPDRRRAFQVWIKFLLGQI